MNRRSMSLVFFVSSLGGLSGQLSAQGQEDPLLRGFKWRAIGPIGQGGRVNDITAVEKDPTTFYVGFATGGIWKTTNAGVTFEPIFDTYGTHSIGDIAIAASNPDVLYVGTGEANNRQSSSFGDGVYRSTDGGKSFTRAGLGETQSIARVIVHPTDPNTVWVAAMGHLFGTNPERGVFKSTDGGKTWRKVLSVDPNTGAADLVIHPANPNLLWATTYTRQRTAWSFASGGPGSGIWKSEDGGEHWTRVSGGGLPIGTMGRIGVDISRSNPNVMYAQIEVAPDKEPVQAERRSGGPAGPAGQGGGGGGQQNLPPDDKVTGIWRSSDGGKTWEFRNNENNRPMYYSQVRVDPTDENTVYVGGASPSKSTDGGKTFKQLTGFGHGDHHAIWIDRNDGRHVMYGNDGSADVSWDGGMTWEAFRNWEVGQPYHASVDMRRPYFVCTGLQDNGSWCGPSSVRGGNILASDWYRVGGGDGFYSQVDATDWGTVYSESQNGNMNRLDLREGTTTNIKPRTGGGGGGGGGGGEEPGGPGGGGGPRSTIVPAPEPGTQLRWNWSTPMLLSPHNPRVLMVGANRLLISPDRGETWTMSPDLTRQIDRDQRAIIGLKGTLPSCGRQRAGACILSKGDGTSFYGTITTISESPLIPGTLWIGTDDGNIQVSRDGGTSWTEVSKTLPGGPKEYYVSRVEASSFDPATAYVSLDGHRSDDLRPYLFVTRDYGKTWSSISGNLPAFGNVNTVKQDPKNAKLLYAGTEFGFFATFDEGGTWKRFTNNLPMVRIDDVLIHPRDNDLILSTHGRSVWVMDDITPLQQMTQEVMDQAVHLFAPRDAVAWKQDIRHRLSVTGSKFWRGESAPAGSTISYYLKSGANGPVKITITDLVRGETFRTMTGTGVAGMNRVQWDLCSDRHPIQPGQGGGGFGGACGGGGFGGGGGPGGPPQVARPATPGVYRVTLTVDGKDYTRTVTVLEDTWME